MDILWLCSECADSWKPVHWRGPIGKDMQWRHWYIVRDCQAFVNYNNNNNNNTKFL